MWQFLITWIKHYSICWFLCDTHSAHGLNISLLHALESMCDTYSAHGLNISLLHVLESMCDTYSAHGLNISLLHVLESMCDTHSAHGLNISLLHVLESMLSCNAEIWFPFTWLTYFCDWNYYYGQITWEMKHLHNMQDICLLNTNGTHGNIFNRAISSNYVKVN